MNKKSYLLFFAFVFSTTIINAVPQNQLPKIPRNKDLYGPITVHTKTTKGGWIRKKEETFHTYELVPNSNAKHPSETKIDIDTDNENISGIMYSALENFPQKDANVFKKIGLIPMVIEINNNSGQSINLKRDNFFINDKIIATQQIVTKKMFQYFGKSTGWVVDILTFLTVLVGMGITNMHLLLLDELEGISYTAAETILATFLVILLNKFFLNEQYGKLRSKIFKSSQVRTLIESIYKLMNQEPKHTAKSQDTFIIPNNRQFKTIVFLNIKEDDISSFIPRLNNVSTSPKNDGLEAVSNDNQEIVQTDEAEEEENIQPEIN